MKDQEVVEEWGDNPVRLAVFEIYIAYNNFIYFLNNCKWVENVELNVCWMLFWGKSYTLQSEVLLINMKNKKNYHAEITKIKPLCTEVLGVQAPVYRRKSFC